MQKTKPESRDFEPTWLKRGEMEGVIAPQCPSRARFLAPVSPGKKEADRENLGFPGVRWEATGTELSLKRSKALPEWLLTKVAR